MTTVADPLSAGLMMMSVQARSLVRASRSFTGRLSSLFLDLERFQGVLFYSLQIYFKSGVSVYRWVPSALFLESLLFWIIVFIVTRVRQPTRRIPLVVTYRLGLTNLSRIARKHLPILHTSSKLKEAIPDPPIIAFRRPKNIKDLLVRAKLNPPSPPTNAINTRCNNNRCKCCHEMVTCSKFKS